MWNTEALRRDLDDALRGAFSELGDHARIEWRAPLARDFYVEPRDRDFWRAIEREDLIESCAGWWPSRGGPVWDAVGLGLRPDAEPVVILIEAKANVPEFHGRFGGTSPRSVAMIDAALEGIRVELDAEAPLEAWKGPHYQLANRLAWTRWLQKKGWFSVFAYVLFSDDRSRIPNTEDELDGAARSAFEALGVDLERLPWAAAIHLPATG
jgi:hypothetical protein